MKLMQKTSLLILLLSLSSCGVWQDFTTFFNTYYNARLNFEEAMTELDTQPRELFEFKEPVPTGKAKTSLTKVIEKCSKILQFDSESSYFDESLLIIGKSFYYQGEYLQALRKFQELTSLSDDVTNLKLEANLWIGKTELQLRNFENGYNVLESVKAEAKESEEEILIDAYIAQIRYLINREQFDNAVNLASELLEISESDERNAEITYNMGKIYLLLDDNENAAFYFNKVTDYSPTFDIEFYSRLEFAKIKKNLGELELSLEVLEDLRSEDKYANFFDEIDFQLGMISYQKENYEDALDLFTEVDTVYSKTEAGGKAKFMRAEIMELVYADYDSAQKFYDKVPVSNAPKEFKNDASAKSINLKKYFDFKYDHDFNSAQLLYIIDNEKFLEDSTAYFKWKNRDTTNLADLFASNKPKFNDEFLADSIRIRLDSVAVDTTLTAFQKDSLNYVLRGLRPPDKEVVQQAVPVQNITVSNVERPSFDWVPKRPTISKDSARVMISESKLKLGNHFFTELNVPDSAFKYFDQVVTDFSDTKYVPQALFSLGGYYELIGDKVTADSLYNMVYQNFKSNRIVNEAAKKLGLKQIDFDSDPAEKAFIDAEELLLNKNYKNSISVLLNINNDFPKSQYAPKSLYTVGWIYENELNKPDSAFFYYDSLLSAFTKTEYAKAIINKVNFYKEEMEKQRKDSIKSQEDSIIQDVAGDIALPIVDAQVSDSLQTTSAITQDSVQVSQQITENDEKENHTPLITQPENVNSIPTGGSQRVYTRGRR